MKTRPFLSAIEAVLKSLNVSSNVPLLPFVFCPMHVIQHRNHTVPDEAGLASAELKILRTMTRLIA
jgi:hypothetical protein